MRLKNNATTINHINGVLETVKTKRIFIFWDHKKLYFGPLEGCFHPGSQYSGKRFLSFLAEELISCGPTVRPSIPNSNLWLKLKLVAQKKKKLKYVSEPKFVGLLEF